MSEFDIRVDYYAALGVAPTASADEIQKAYHALAAKYHPDKHQGNELEELAREKLTQLNAAFAVVGNPDRRARYDAARRGASASRGPSAAGNAPSEKPKADPASLVRTILILVAVVVAVPFVLRFLKNPRLLAVIAGVALALWLGPRIIRYFRS